MVTILELSGIDKKNYNVDDGQAVDVPTLDEIRKAPYVCYVLISDFHFTSFMNYA